MTDRNDRYVVT